MERERRVILASRSVVRKTMLDALIGATSSPFTVESAYASVRTVDGRSGADISDEELEDIIDEAKARYAERLIEELDRDA